jgi:6-phosphogluconate dehydrogenase (decarboxylating)
MGKAKFFLGAVGKGAEMKLVVNGMMSVMMATFAEGLSLADKVCVCLLLLLLMSCVLCACVRVCARVWCVVVCVRCC